MAATVEEFGLATLEVRKLIEWTVADLGSRDAGAACTMCSTAVPLCKLPPFASSYLVPAITESSLQEFGTYLSCATTYIYLSLELRSPHWSSGLLRSQAHATRRLRCWRRRTGSWARGWRTWCARM